MRPVWIYEPGIVSAQLEEPHYRRQTTGSSVLLFQVQVTGVENRSLRTHQTRRLRVFSSFVMALGLRWTWNDVVVDSRSKEGDIFGDIDAMLESCLAFQVPSLIRAFPKTFAFATLKVSIPSQQL